ncbi:MAG: MFS transporter [Proteobacteria bacterium]|nr:MFS transporter [Pseudomonadota bacterium]
MQSRWGILALLFIARIGLGFQFQTLGTVSEELVEELGLNYAQIGSLIGLFMVPGMFLAIPAGLAGRFFSDRFIVGFGLLAVGTGGGLASVAESFEFFAAARVICGVGFVFSTVFFTKIVADMFVGKELATAMGALVMSWPGGIAIAQIGGGWLAINFDWQMAFIVASVYCVVAALLVMIFCKDVPGVTKQSGGLRFTLNRNEIVLILISSLVWGFFNAGYVVYLSFAPSVLVEVGYDTVSALSIISLASWLMIVSGIVCGYIADRSGRPDLVLYVCMASAVFALVLLFIAPMAIPSSLLFGLLGIAPAGVIMALAGQAMKPENRAIGMGLFFTFYFVAQAPAPAIAGWLYDMTADLYWPIGFAILMFVITATANIIFRIVQKRLPL